MDADLIESLLATIRERDRQISLLLARVSALEAELAIYKNKKNSNNSHTPPSRDENRTVQKNQSLRQKSGKKAGGQQGHKGKTLDCSVAIDSEVAHMPNYCSCCGDDLTDVPEVWTATRKVVDIPVIKPICVAHRSYRKTCGCGPVSEAAFPTHITAAVQYGAQVESLVGYLHARQYLPYDRMKEFFTDVMGLPVSAGGIGYMLKRLTQKAMPHYEQIKARICRAQSIGTDETGVKVNGRKDWMWTWQNDALTYIVHSGNRGFQTIADQFANGLPKAVLGHDRLAAHFKCPAGHHQICMAHLLRDLRYIRELYKEECRWATAMNVMITEALQLKKQLTTDQYAGTCYERQLLEARLHELLFRELDKTHRKAKTLQKSLRRHPGYILHFLRHPQVPPDNNGSERAIRNVKVKQKISGQFKSDQGADGFAVLRSVIDTTIKSGKNVLNALALIATLGTE